MFLLVLKILLIIIIFLLLVIIAFLCVPITYNLLFVTENKKIEIKIYPKYLISIFNIVLSKNKNLSNNINKLDKYISIEGAEVKENIINDDIINNDNDEIEKQIEKYKSDENVDEKLSSKSLLKDSAKAEKQISENIDDDKNIIEKLKSKFENILNIVKKLNDEDVKKLISFVLMSIKNILINKNTKLYADLNLGIDDPYMMGNILSIISVLYSLNGDRIKVIPYFDKKVLYGYVKIVGKIYLMQILVILIRIYFSKGFKKLFK